MVLLTVPLKTEKRCRMEPTAGPCPNTLNYSIPNHSALPFAYLAIGFIVMGSRNGSSVTGPPVKDCKPTG